MPPNLAAFALLAVATSVTAGPNNIMVASSAASSGVRATVPHMLGISLGFGAMVAVVGLGVAGPLADHPAMQGALRWIGGA
jgi:threonine/homoserine/homoserine lactone efflux protein